MEEAQKIINAFSEKTIDSAVKGFIVEQNDEITNKAREYLDALSENELIGIQEYLKTLLNYCYEGKILDEAIDENDARKIANLTEKERFLLKESIIYFYRKIKVRL